MNINAPSGPTRSIVDMQAAALAAQQAIMARAERAAAAAIVQAPESGAISAGGGTSVDVYL